MAHKNLLRDFKRPKNIIFEHEEVNPFYGRFIAAPFERGFGVTIANSLRRTLLSSIQGYAITAIRVEYINKEGKNSLLTNEFESIYGVYEDTVQLIQNLKLLRIKLLDDSENRTIFVEKKGEGILTAGDLEIDANVMVFNPELKIASLNEDASLFIEFQINLGRGYIAAERNLEYIQTIGTIPIDAIFTPIQKVNYRIENTRVGQRTDYDKFVLELWTDGSIRPDDAVADAAKILKEHFTCFINFEEEEEHEEEMEDPEEERMRTLLKTAIEELELSVRSSNCLRVAGVKTIGDLVIKNEEEISKIKNLGKKSITEIQHKLNSLNLAFGMKSLSHLTKSKVII
ncbi:MAG: DNA-directed RNA polymerase subunit alpha [Spirochaetota bacterium]|nr:DNA-directed RNA polymerase subunit alpha [Spirochaetota bacterium]